MLAKKMKNNLGGWIFHRKIDFDKPTPWITLTEKNHPRIMNKWVKEHEKVRIR